jgi:hypothetical protein
MLLLFAGLFTALIVALEIVRKLSKEMEGFGPTVSGKHLIWTYVPAAGMFSSQTTRFIDGTD